MLDGFWCIAAESRLVRPGRLTAAATANQAIVLVCNRSGAVPALENRCSHRGVPLSSGRLDGESIQCPYHGWRFSTSGACLEAPVLAAGAAPKSACVRSYPVQEQDGRVWIYMGNERCPIPAVPPPYPTSSIRFRRKSRSEGASESDRCRRRVCADKVSRPCVTCRVLWQPYTAATWE